MKVTVDRARCESNALCVTAAPTVFELLDDDTLVVLLAEPPDHLADQVAKSERLCPTRAITVHHDT